MNSLTGADKRWLENAFDMNGGYVLDFKNWSFERFFHDYGVDIYSARYQTLGNSKADRLRAFWDTEPDDLVGRILFGLFDSYGFLEGDSEKSRKSRVILSKLSGIPIEERILGAWNGRFQESKVQFEDKQLENLWGPGSIRVFISHIAQHKSEAKKIKDSLKDFGIASFVAHDDIEPSSEWQSEIVRALESMSMFIALLTEGFKESNWTDQEVGFAVARGVLILPVSRGIDPYGFIGKIQALRWSASSAFPVAHEVMILALKSDKLKSRAKRAFIEALAKSESWSTTKILSYILPNIDSLTSDEADWFVDVYNSSSEVYKEFRIKGEITDELRRMTGNNYMIDSYSRLQKTQQSEDIPF